MPSNRFISAFASSAEAQIAPPLDSGRRPRIAVFGGDGRLPARLRRELGTGVDVRVFGSARDGGIAGRRRLHAAVTAGGVDAVLILTKWNGHSATHSIRCVCRERGVPVRLVA